MNGGASSETLWCTSSHFSQTKRSGWIYRFVLGRARDWIPFGMLAKLAQTSRDVFQCLRINWGIAHSIGHDSVFLLPSLFNWYNSPPFMFIPCILINKCLLYTNICTNKWCKFVLKLLRHVSVSIHHPQTVYSCVS